jgi:GNAT superfamily N-acetyltransferase
LIGQASAGLSAESLWRRFGAGCHALPLPYLKLLRSEPGEARLFVAFDDEQLVGWAEARPAGPDEAEVAVVVLDGWQRRGVGTSLVRALLADAAVTGRRLHAYVHPDNMAASRLVRAALPGPVEAGLADGYVRFRQAAA